MARSKAARARSAASLHCVASSIAAQRSLPVRYEVTPARMEWHVEVWVGRARGLDDQIGGRVEPT